jgi:hypothetical protein
VESPSMAEVGAPVILSLGVAGYFSVRRPCGGGAHRRWRPRMLSCEPEAPVTKGTCV